VAVTDSPNSPEVAAHLAGVAQHAERVLAELRAGEERFISHRPRPENAATGSRYDTDVERAVTLGAQREGLEIRWENRDDIGTSVNRVT
jgi:hypothetical protein